MCSVPTGVAGEAAVVDFFRGMIGKDENLRLVAAAGDVGGAGAVAAFTSLMRRTTFRVEGRFPVRSLFPAVVDLLVAGLADLRAEIVGILRLAGGGGEFCFESGRD